MKKRKKRSKFYFDTNVEDAIVEYNNEEDYVKRNIIYNERIKYAIEKLAENIINTFKFPYIHDRLANKKADVVSHLILNLDKYDKTKGKAYSYFGQAAKNYLIINNDSNYKKLKSEMSIYKDDGSEDIVIDIEDSSINYDKLKTEKQELIELLIEYLEKNVNLIFKKPKELKIANAIIQLLQNHDSIENFNKKNIYIMIREMTDYRAQYITRVLNKIKDIYQRKAEEYALHGEITFEYDDNILESTKKFF